MEKSSLLHPGSLHISWAWLDYTKKLSHCLIYPEVTKDCQTVKLSLVFFFEKRIINLAMKPHIFQAATLGIGMALAVFLGAFIGHQIDVRIGSEPWGMAAGILIGAILGFWNIFRFATETR